MLIIGGGPAGLSCAFYLAQKGYKPTVFEKNKKAGGMLVYGIPSFKLEKDVVEAEIDVMRQMGVDIKTGVEVGKDITIDELKKQGYKAFYIAIGCQGSRKAGVAGEDAKGVMSAVDFLKEAGSTHEFPLEGDVVVIGGGNVAIDVARTSTRVGDYNVSMFCLEDRANMPASEEEIEEAVEEGVKLDCGWGPKEILTENGKVTGIVLKRCTSVKDADGRFNPQYDENDTKTVKCSHVFLSIGQTTIWGDLLKGTKVEIDGVRVKADKLTYQTTDPDVFIGGDVYTGPRFAIDAIAAGKEAAISIHRYVQPHSSLTIGRNRRDFIELDKNNIKVESYDNSSRQIPGTDNSFDHKKSFRDANIYDGEKIAKPIEKEIFTEERYNDEPDKFITQNVEPRTLTIKELKKSIREIKSVGGDTREFLVELGNRYSFPFASFIISFLGLSLGSRYVRGASAINLALSVALGYGYYIVQASFEALSINGFLNPFIGGWIPNIIFLVVGIYFVYRSEY